jgi:hypothetical protein
MQGLPKASQLIIIPSLNEGTLFTEKDNRLRHMVMEMYD